MSPQPEPRLPMGTPAADTEAEREIGSALARASVYRVLSLAAAYPTPARLVEVTRAAAGASALASLPPACADALRTLAHAAADTAPEEIAREYVFLFDGAVRCPPYEGAYGPPSMAGKGAVLADISGFYSAFGLAPEGGGQAETEDHVTAELEFMSVLALKEAWARLDTDTGRLDVTREAQAGFLTDHLTRWVDAFAAELRTATTLPYYATLADAIVAWVRSETEALGVTRATLGERGTPDEAAPFTCPMADEAADG